MEGFDYEIPHRTGSGPFICKRDVSASSPCQEKEQEIQREISYAEKHNNQSRIDGLNKALHEVRTNCSDSKLRAEHQRKIARQKDEVAERRDDLAKAKQKGDADKISKREHKLKEAETELKALEARDY
jgi:chromosome segregation ATPase